MKRAMLEVVASGVVTTSDDVSRYVRCTLLAAMNAFEVSSTCPHIAGLSSIASRLLLYTYMNRKRLG